MVMIASCAKTGELISPARNALFLVRERYPEGLLCFGCKRPVTFVRAAYEGGISWGDKPVLRAAHFRHIDPAHERQCFYSTLHQPESEPHLMLKGLQIQSWQNAIATHFKGDELIVVPEKTVKDGNKHRRPDVGLQRKDIVIGGGEVQLSELPPQKLIDRIQDHDRLGLRGVLWSAGGNLPHIVGMTIARYDIAQVAIVNKKDVTVVGDNGVLCRENRIVSVAFELWDKKSWDAIGEARTSRITTIEDDAGFIENVIKASERREVKTFSVFEPKLKEQGNKLIPYDCSQEANILESGKIKVGDRVASTDPLG